MRVYDFGWRTARKGWGSGGEGTMRLQMHATDPDVLENRLDTPQSKGCIRIPATLNTFIDHYGILDAAYEEAMAEGMTFWVLSKAREATPWSGRFLVVVDTGRSKSPHGRARGSLSLKSPVQIHQPQPESRLINNLRCDQGWGFFLLISFAPAADDHVDALVGDKHCRRFADAFSGTHAL
jgi:hypothetical protein